MRSCENNDVVARSTACVRRVLRSRWVIRTFLLLGALTMAEFLLSTVLYGSDNNSNTPSTTRPRSQDALKSITDSFFPDSATDKEKQKTAEAQYASVFTSSANHTITLQDLNDMEFDDDDSNTPNTTWDEAAALRQPLLDLLQSAGLSVDVHVLQRLPTWEQVVDLYGESSVLLGQEQCADFRASIAASERFVGVAGQMNTGTNALSKYLQHNIMIRDNEVNKGVLWTVPWFKHGWASLKGRYKYRIPANHSLVMAVVLVKDPYFWMRSTSVGVKLRWGKFTRRWPSLADVWSSWYKEYVEADPVTMPRLMIRYEDLLLRPYETVNAIRECVGAEWKSKEFVWQAAPAKTHPYFAKYKAPSSLVSALIKYGKDSRGRMGTMNAQDQLYAQKHIDKDLLALFHYKDPRDGAL